MSAIVIESGIPIPPPARMKSKSVYPFRELEVGQSFLAPWRDGEEPRKFLSKLSSKASEFGKRTGRVFRCRSYSEGVRVWRVA